MAPINKCASESALDFDYLKEAMRHSEPTVDASAKALNRFEIYTKPLFDSRCADGW